MPYRLRAYAPDGAALGLLPDPLEFTPMVAHNDVGSLALTYTSVAAGGQHLASALDTGLEVAVEAWLGPGPDDWTEPKGCRFVRITDGDDPADPTRSISLELPSYAWLLSKAKNYATAGLNDAGERLFAAPTVGSLLLTLLNENAARGGVCQAINATFTATHDSAGVAWPTLPDQVFPLGVDVLSILDELTAKGALDWTTQQRGLYAYVPDSTTLSPDLSGDDGVVLQLGVDVSSAPNKRTIENLAGRMYVRTEAGGVAIATEPTAPAPWGTWEGFIQVGSVTDQSAAVAVGDAELERVGKVRGQYTRDLILTPRSKRPLVDYWPGAWIKAPGSSAVAEKLRVQQMTLTVRGTAVSGAATLNDLLLEGDERRARTLASLAGGGSISPAGPPAPVAVDPEAARIPTTPPGFAAVAALYFDAGVPRGVVTASWGAVTTATDGGDLAIAGYQLQYRVDGGDWQTITTPQLTADIHPLVPQDELELRVRTVGARTTLPSAWAPIQTVTVPGDVTPPPVPTAPAVDGSMTIISVTWDGTLAGVMPPDFARVEVALGATETPTTVRGTLTRTGTVQIEGEPIGAPRWVRLRAVDTTGNPSAWTAAVPVTAQSVVADELAAAINDAIDQALTGPVDGSRVTPWTVGPEKLLIGLGDELIANPGFETGAIAPWLPQSGTPAAISTTARTGQYALQLTPANRDATALRVLHSGGGSTGGPFVQVGDNLIGSIWVRLASGSADVALGLWARNATAGIVNSASSGFTTLVAGVWTRLSVNVSVAGAAAKFAQIGLDVRNTSSAVLLVDDGSMRRRMTGELIVDGAITALKLAAGAVTADSIAAGAIDGKVITGATIRTAASGDRLEMSTAGLLAWRAGTVAAELTPGGLVLHDGGELTVENQNGDVLLRAGRYETQTWRSTQFVIADLAGNAVFDIDVPDAGTGGTNIAMAADVVQVYQAQAFLADTQQTAFLGVRGGTSTFKSQVDLSPSRVLVEHFDYEGTNSHSVLDLVASGASLKALSPGGLVQNSIDVGPSTIIETYNNSWRAAPSGTPTWEGGPSNGTLAILASHAGVSVAYGSETNAANAYLTTAGTIRRSSSSLRYKQDVEDLVVDPALVLQMQPRTWRDKGAVERDPDTTHRIPGFIAEELDALGLTLFVTYEGNGPESIQYDRISAAHQVVLRDHEDRTTALEQTTTAYAAEIANLKNRLAALEAQ